MQAFVSKHPIWTQVLVQIGIVILSIPLWVLLWWVIAETGRMIIEEGCRARGYSCLYESQGFIIFSLILLPLFFAGYILSVNRLTKTITHRLLRWAGLNPEIALL